MAKPMQGPRRGAREPRPKERIPPFQLGANRIDYDSIVCNRNEES